MLNTFVTESRYKNVNLLAEKEVGLYIEIVRQLSALVANLSIDCSAPWSIA